jgi:hypothetical protein
MIRPIGVMNSKSRSSYPAYSYYNSILLIVGVQRTKLTPLTVSRSCVSSPFKCKATYVLAYMRCDMLFSHTCFHLPRPRLCLRAYALTKSSMPLTDMELRGVVHFVSGTSVPHAVRCLTALSLLKLPVAPALDYLVPGNLPVLLHHAVHSRLAQFVAYALQYVRMI